MTVLARLRMRDLAQNERRCVREEWNKFGWDQISILANVRSRLLDAVYFLTMRDYIDLARRT